MPFRISLRGTDSIRNIIVIMRDIPNPILRLQFISLVSSRFKCLNLLRQLDEQNLTFSISADKPFTSSLIML